MAQELTSYTSKEVEGKMAKSDFLNFWLDHLNLNEPMEMAHEPEAMAGSDRTGSGLLLVRVDSHLSSMHSPSSKNIVMDAFNSFRQLRLSES